MASILQSPCPIPGGQRGLCTVRHRASHEGLHPDTQACALTSQEKLLRGRNSRDGDVRGGLGYVQVEGQEGTGQWGAQGESSGLKGACIAVGIWPLGAWRCPRERAHRESRGLWIGPGSTQRSGACDMGEHSAKQTEMGPGGWKTSRREAEHHSEGEELNEQWGQKPGCKELRKK